MRWWVGVLVAGVLVATAGAVRLVMRDGGPVVTAPSPSVVMSGAPKASESPSPPPPVLQKPGDIATHGPGTFTYATDTGPLLGTSGTLRRFHVAVESNVSGELDEFTAAVDQVFGDPRSWIAGKQVRFQRVPRGQTAEFTVYLVTRETAYRMCAVNGGDNRVDGVPYTSCRQVRKVIINLDRWRLSVPHYVTAGVPLQAYREYVLNHEVGHELGRGHEACTGVGNPAPTMMQQTLFLNGCIANPWPYLDGKRYAGPPVR